MIHGIAESDRTERLNLIELIVLFSGRIPWTEDSDKLWFIGSEKLGHVEGFKHAHMHINLL